MCGIAGLVSLSGQPVLRQDLMRLTAAVRHRGPDGNGVWLSPTANVGLAHTRLSILDLSDAAAQPMISTDQRHILVFNGEIYNFLELAEELRQSGCSFRSRSDTEVILEGYRRWGIQLFDRLNGMWAIALHDTVTNETLLCRDRFGVKPLYVHHQPGQVLIFASEASAIDRFLGGRLTADTEYLLAVGRRSTGDRSCFRDVVSLSPGHMLRISAAGDLSKSAWYQLRLTESGRNLQEQAEHFRALLVDACRIRLRSDVPVATCLSGGIDSGSIVALLHRGVQAEQGFSGFNHRSFNAAFPGTTQDETSAARQLAVSCGVDLDCHVIKCPKPDELDTALKACDGPMPCMAFYPIWSLYRHIRAQGIKVTLDGMGPDEYLGGYYIGGQALQGAWETGSPTYLLDIWNTYSALYDHSRRQANRDALAVVRGALARIRRRAQRLPITPRPWDAGPAGAALQSSGALTNTLERCLWDQVFGCPLPYLLHQYDRCSMANGVESRFPFMDYRLIELSFSLTLQSRIGGGFTKRILRAAMRGVLPDTIRLNRRKTGFNSPFSDWLRGPLRTWVGDIAGSSAFAQSDCFDGRGLQTQIHSSLYQNAGDLHEWDIWMPLHLTWWQQNKSVSVL